MMQSQKSINIFKEIKIKNLPSASQGVPLYRLPCASDSQNYQHSPTGPYSGVPPGLLGSTPLEYHFLNKNHLF